MWVKKRPGVDKFLAMCHPLYDLAVWSASSRPYIDAIVSHVIPYPLVFIYDGHRCTYHAHFDWNGDKSRMNLKKLCKVWRLRRYHYNRTNTLILDDDSETYMQNYGNSIPIAPYHGSDTDDEELDRVTLILKTTHQVSDVRFVDKRCD